MASDKKAGVEPTLRGPRSGVHRQIYCARQVAVDTGKARLMLPNLTAEGFRMRGPCKAAQKTDTAFRFEAHAGSRSQGRIIHARTQAAFLGVPIGDFNRRKMYFPHGATRFRASLEADNRNLARNARAFGVNTRRECGGDSLWGAGSG